MNNRYYSLLIFSFLFVSCNAYSKMYHSKRPITSIDKMGPDDRDKWQTETIRAFLKKNGYKEPSPQMFRDKCLFLFGLSLPKVPQTTVRPIRAVNTDYTINEFGRFIYPDSEDLFYQPWIEGEVTKEEARRFLENHEQGIGDKLVAYNKLLFNDDATTLAYFKKEPDEAVEIVFQFDYEQNPTLTKRAIEYARLSDVLAYQATEILFYNNEKRGIRKNLIAQIYEQCAKNRDDFKDFEKIIMAYYKDFERLKYEVEIKDQCLVYLIMCLMDYDNKNKEAIIEPRGSKAFQHLGNFLSEYPDMENRLKARNFYDNSKLKELVKTIHLWNEAAVGTANSKAATYRIDDPDGYCNLREKDSTASRIIERIPSGSPIRVLETNGNWWKVATSEGKTGYIHKSRIVKAN